VPSIITDEDFFFLEKLLFVEDQIEKAAHPLDKFFFFKGDRVVSLVDVTRGQKKKNIFERTGGNNRHFVSLESRHRLSIPYLSAQSSGKQRKWQPRNFHSLSHVLTNNKSLLIFLFK